MHARFLDMLEHAAHRDVGPVADRVDVDFDRVAQIAVDQHRALARHLHRGRDIMVELLRPLDHLHAAPAEHVGRPQQHRIADPLRDPHRLVAAARDPVRRLLEAELLHQRREPLAILGEVDAVGRGPEDRHARRLQLLGKLQRRLPAELDDHAEQFALLLLPPDDLQHVLGRQRLEIEPVRRVRVGRHRLRIAIDHDRLEARPRRGPSAKAAWQQQ